MKSGVGKHILAALSFALALYAVSYFFIEHARNRKGGWRVEFLSDGAGHPSVKVAQTALNLTNIQFRLIEERIAQTNLQEFVIFDHPLTNVPFGEVIFIDTTFLPGTVAFDFFGHEVQLMPRVLMVNKREIPWRSDRAFELSPKEKLPHAPRRSQWKK